MPSTASTLLHDALRVDRAQLQNARGVRYAVGVGAPLLVGVADGRPIEGVAVSAGAVLVGLTDSGAPYARRTREMLVAAAAAAISMLLGQLVGADDAATVALLAAWSLLAGLCIAAGTAAYLVALIAPVTMVGATSVPAGGLVALGRAGLVLAGGLIQVVLVLVMWRLHPDRPERSAVARLYRALADWFGAGPGTDDRAPVFAAIAGCRDALGPEGQDESGHQLWQLVSLGDRILARLPPLGGAGIDRTEVRCRLREVADRLQRDRRDRSTAGTAPAADQAGSITAAALPVELDRDLRNAVELAAAARRHRFAPARRRFSPRPGLRLAAIPSVRVAAVRHAIRLSLTVAVATALERALSLPHGYWVGLTVLWLLRPEFGATFTRGIQRYAGTVAGAAGATLLVALVHPGPYGLAIVATGLAAGIFAFMLANYALTAACTTGWVVLVAALAGLPELGAAADRLLATTLGAVLALGAYLLWPTWERPAVPAMLADLIEHDRRFVVAVLTAWADPARADQEAIAQARTESRLARTTTEAALARTMAEPESSPGRLDPRVAEDLLRTLRQMCDGAVVLESTLDGRAGPAIAERVAVRTATDAALAGLADAVREPGRAPAIVSIEPVDHAPGVDRIAASVAAAAAALRRPAAPVSRPTDPLNTTDPRSGMNRGRR